MWFLEHQFSCLTGSLAGTRAKILSVNLNGASARSVRLVTGESEIMPGGAEPWAEVTAA